MNIAEITRFAIIKGLNLIGTGDFTHPKWLKELTEELIEIPNTHLYETRKRQKTTIRYMLTAEVSTIFTVASELKKIHHIIFAPSLETATQISERLQRFGDLGVDGRPTLKMSAPQLVEEVMQVSEQNVVIPSHAWTPWFSIFGAFSGFDRVEECYQDMTKHIPAIETGLSSDPSMNWRVSALDRFALLSNSDCHSPWPWRIGREANVFELERVTFQEIVDAIRKKDPQRFKFTIETDPAYGKYHLTGHRNCNVSLSPQEAVQLGNRCPVCGRKLTKGVEQRVEELADRPRGANPRGAIGYIKLLPLTEIIAAIVKVRYPGTQKVWNIYNPLIKRFGDEYTVLIDASLEEMCQIVDNRIAQAVIKVREGRAKVIPGYDGVYGQLRLEERKEKGRLKQKNIADFL
jgi:uncharacterized protein (TIGR00375 family)